MKRLALSTATVLGVTALAAPAEAFTIFSDRSLFESQLDTFIVDDYSDQGYSAGDLLDFPTFDRHSNANMSSILGEAQYTSTGFPDNNFILGQNLGDPYYCAGCNGSFLLDFTSTSVGTSDGVFGVGFDIEGVEEGVLGTVAFVTFGDGSTDNFFLPEFVDAFWGITSDLQISSIAFGLENGDTNTDNSVQRMALDNLTIGSSEMAADVPEPASTLAFLAFGATAAGAAMKKKQTA